jgi:DNA-binding transcriptional ArsR family regulator
MSARVELNDPRALRALAHPTRLALVGLLRREGPMTATQAAQHVGESPSSCSFHLRQLAKWGLVEEAGGGRGRERPWRATGLATTWQSAPGDPHASAATTALNRVVARQYFEEISRWLDREEAEDPKWRELSGVGDWILYLTLSELRELERGIDELVEPFVERVARRELRPAGSRGLSFIHAIVPAE